MKKGRKPHEEFVIETLEQLDLIKEFIDLQPDNKDVYEIAKKEILEHGKVVVNVVIIDRKE